MKTKLNLLPAGLLALGLFPAQVSQAQVTVTQIAAGGQHTLFIKSDGSLWGMGYNYNGQLGDGTGTFQTNVPEMIVSNGVTAVAANYNHSFFQIGSALWAMGDNQFGQLGDGTTNNAFVPEQIANVITLGAGSFHTLFTRSSGVFRDLYVMGNNQYGELGDSSLNNTNQPKRIEHDSTLAIGATYVTAAAAGGGHSLLLKNDGSLWGMGSTYRGALGDGHGQDGILFTNQAEKILPSGVTAIAAGNNDSLFIKSDGSLWATGGNDYGGLGSPNVPNGFGTNHPVMIVPGNVTAISAGLSHNLFLKSNGSLWAMGWNFAGQLGDGTLNDTNKPEQIVAGGVTTISAGTVDSLFLLADGSLWGMGETYAGQLGSGVSLASDQLTPAQIIGPTVANGGFESDDFLGWTLQGPTVDVHVITNTVSAHSGFAAAEFGTVGTRTSLSQTLHTTPGASYSLSFWLKSDGTTPSEFIARWNGSILIDQPGFASGTWFRIQYSVKATSTNTVVEFDFRDDPGFIDFDDVNVVPLIQPTITGITTAGTNLVLNATDGQWNGSYATLMSTNLLQPLFLWTPLATNMLDGSGNFTITVTNAVNPTAPQRFYVLRLQ